MSTRTATARHPLLNVAIISILIAAAVIGFAYFCPLYSEHANEEQSVVNGINAETTAQRMAGNRGVYPEPWLLEDSLAVFFKPTNPYTNGRLEIVEVTRSGRLPVPFTGPTAGLEGNLGYYVSDDGRDATIIAYAKDGRVAEQLKLPTLPRR